MTSLPCLKENQNEISGGEFLIAVYSLLKETPKTNQTTNKNKPRTKMTGEKGKYEQFTLQVPLVKISVRIKHRQGHLEEVLSMIFFHWGRNSSYICL